MTDITKCNDKECPMKDKCYRFTAPSDEYQAYFLKSPRKGEDCEYLYLRGKDFDEYKLSLKI